MLLPHNKVSGGVQDSQIMIPSFFDRFYVMPPLTNGVHYTFLLEVFENKFIYIKVGSLKFGQKSLLFILYCCELQLFHFVLLEFLFRECSAVFPDKKRHGINPCPSKVLAKPGRTQGKNPCQTMFGTFFLLSVLPKQNCKFFDGTVKFTYKLSNVALSFRLLPQVSFSV